jgi:hypothetical protein
MLQRQCIHDRQHRVAWPAAAQEDQAQEPLRTHQLPTCRDPQAVRKAIDLWRPRCPNPDANALMFPRMRARAPKATGDADSSRQLAAPASVPGRETIGDRISPYVSGAPQEFLHAWQEGSTPHRDASPTRTQRHSHHLGYLYADFGPGSSQNGEPGHKSHFRVGRGRGGRISSVRWARRIRSEGFLLE